MVRALLAGIKTQTRRVLNPQPSRDHYGKDIMDWGLSGIYHDEENRAPSKWWLDVQTDVDDNSHREFDLRYAVGDRLYVREAWKTHAAYDDISPAAMGGEEPILYEADGAHQTWGYPAISKIGRFRQGMHMPRWASRLTLSVTDVRVQRLQEISCADAIAEGIPASANSQTIDCDTADPRASYRQLWDSLNADRGFSWDSNHWVVAVSFSVERRNIDEVA